MEFYPCLEMKPVYSTTSATGLILSDCRQVSLLFSESLLSIQDDFSTALI